MKYTDLRIWILQVPINVAKKVIYPFKQLFVNIIITLFIHSNIVCNIIIILFIVLDSHQYASVLNSDLIGKQWTKR